MVGRAYMLEYSMDSVWLPLKTHGRAVKSSESVHTSVKDIGDGPPKGSYETARDKRVAEIQEMFKPMQEATKALRKSCSGKNPREPRASAQNPVVPTRWSSRKSVVQKFVAGAYSDMATKEESDETKTEDDYIPDCDEDLESVHEAMVDLVGSIATKGNRARQILKTPEKNVAPRQVNNPSTTCTQAQWQWMQPLWMQPGVMGQQMQPPPRVMGQQGPWMMGQ